MAENEVTGVGVIGERRSDLLQEVIDLEDRLVTPRLARLDADAHAAELVLAGHGAAVHGARLEAARRIVRQLLREADGDIAVVATRLTGLAAEVNREQVPQVCAMVEVFANDADPVAAMAAAWKLMDRNEAGWMKQFGTKESPVSDVMGMAISLAALQPLEQTSRYPGLEAQLLRATWEPLRMGKLEYQVATVGAGYREKAAMVVRLPGGGLGVTTAALLYEYAAEREAMEGRDAPVWVPGGNRLEMRRRMLERAAVTEPPRGRGLGE
jgi:hypothetical protein